MASENTDSLYLISKDLETKLRNDNLASSPYQFGPVVWAFLHIHSLGYPSNPTIEEQQSARNLTFAYINLIPCMKCRTNAMEFISTNPPKVENKQEYFAWMVRLHNHANEKTRKKPWSVEEAFEYWSNYNPYANQNVNTKPVPQQSTIQTAQPVSIVSPSQPSVVNNNAQEEKAVSLSDPNQKNNTTTTTTTEETSWSFLQILFVGILFFLAIVLAVFLYKKRNRLNPYQIVDPSENAIDNPTEITHAQDAQDIFLRGPKNKSKNFDMFPQPKWKNSNKER